MVGRFLILLICFIISGCSPDRIPINYRFGLTPYETYKKSLVVAHLDSSLMGRAWIETGEKVLEDTLYILSPFKGISYFKAEEPGAISYRLDAEIGEMISIEVDMDSSQSGKIFLDVFEDRSTNTNTIIRRLISADSTPKLYFNVLNPFPLIIRLQPELLVSGLFTISIISQPSLAFPVSGKDVRSVGSIWGDPRDSGRRSHKGLDIFAKRGTPVLAGTNGRITRVGTTSLGGKVVWLRDDKSRQHLYYAHLLEQMVTRGQQVVIGDTLGLVGDSGNAKGTSPHLHFGVYLQGFGPVNPFPFVNPQNSITQEVENGFEILGKWATVKKSTVLNQSPNSISNMIKNLDKDFPVRILGASSSWLRVSLPDHSIGYISASSIEPSINLAFIESRSSNVLRNNPVASAQPINYITRGSMISVVGEYEGYLLVESQSGFQGWLLDQSFD